MNMSANQKAAMQAGAQASARVLAPLHAEAASALREAASFCDDMIFQVATEPEAAACVATAKRYRALAERLEQET